MQRVQSLHTFTMDHAYDHEDEGTTEVDGAHVKATMEKVKQVFPGSIPDHRLVKATNKILEPLGFTGDNTLLATSLAGDEMCRDLEDEFRAIYGANYNFGGIAGFPFGGATALGGFLHHVPREPSQGNLFILYGPHVGVDYDGTVGKVNRKGHKGSGACCVTALHYVKAVHAGENIASPDPTDPVDAQQVFIDTALLKQADRLDAASDPQVELPHILFDCIDELLGRIVAKCQKDIPAGTKIALLGGVQINTGQGLPDYFLPKKFNLLDDKGKLTEDMLPSLVEEGAKDPRALLKQRKAEKAMADVTPPPRPPSTENLITINIDPTK